MLFAGVVGHSKSHLFLLPPHPPQLSEAARVRPDFKNIFFEPGINLINYIKKTSLKLDFSILGQLLGEKSTQERKKVFPNHRGVPAAGFFGGKKELSR